MFSVEILRIFLRMKMDEKTFGQIGKLIGIAIRSKIAELEAVIKQLEFENKTLKEKINEKENIK